MPWREFGVEFQAASISWARFGIWKGQFARVAKHLSREKIASMMLSVTRILALTKFQVEVDLIYFTI